MAEIESYKLYQTLNKPEELENYDFLMFFIQNYKNCAIILAVYLMISIFFFYLLKKKTNFKFTLSNLFSLSALSYDDLSTLPFKAPLISLFFAWSLFLWMYLNFLSNEITTETVIVNTDEFIDSTQKLLKTPKTFLFFHLDEDVYKNAPKGSVLYELYFKKVKKQKNFFKYVFNGDEKSTAETKYFHAKNRLNSFFAIGRREYFFRYQIFLNQFINTEKQFGYLNPQTFQEYQLVSFMRKNLDKTLKKRIHKT